MSDADQRMDGDPDGTIVVSGGHGPNFDDFESMEGAREQYAEAQEEKSEPSVSDAEEKKVGEAVADEDTQAAADKEVDTSPEKDPEKIEVKFLKAKLGDREMELDPEMEIPVTINGQTEYRKLSDLRNHEAGQVAWDKKFTDLDTQMKEREAKVYSREQEFSQFEADRDSLFQDIGKMHEYIEQGKPVDAMTFLVAQSGGNPYAFKRALLDQLTPEFERLSHMTPEEIRAEVAEEENHFLREQQRSSEEERQRELSHREAQVEIQNLREARGITQEQYAESVEDLKRANRDNPDPRLVVEHAFMKPLVAKAEDLIQKVAPSYFDNDDVVVEMAKIFAEDPALTEAEATELLRDALGVGEKEQRVLEKAKDAGMVRREPENPGNHKYYGSRDPGDDDFIESFADYDELY
jgi:hypothetical protein